MATTNYNTALEQQQYDPTLATPTGGLINAPATGATTANPNPSAATAATATPANWSVTGDQTVQGQIKNIIDENSPLMQQAATGAKQESNKRGLINSSMAVEAGQAALYKSALPIASADAQTNASAAQFSAGAQQQTNLANQTATNAMTQFNIGNDIDVAKFNASESNALKKLGMDAQTKIDLAQTEASYKTLMQTNASAADLYKQIVLNSSNIMSSNSMDAAAKSTAIKNQITLLNNGLGIIGQISNLNLSNLLTFDAVPGV